MERVRELRASPVSVFHGGLVTGEGGRLEAEQKRKEGEGKKGCAAVGLEKFGNESSKDR